MIEREKGESIKRVINCIDALVDVLDHAEPSMVLHISILYGTFSENKSTIYEIGIVIPFVKC